jgi:hypothetical protein
MAAFQAKSVGQLSRFGQLYGVLEVTVGKKA